MVLPTEVDSIKVAGQIVDIFLDGVIRDQTNKMVEKNKRPYVVAHSTLTGLTCVEMY